MSDPILVATDLHKSYADTHAVNGLSLEVRRGYDGWIVVEQDVLPGMGTPKETTRRNRDFLASLIL